VTSYLEMAAAHLTRVIADLDKTPVLAGEDREIRLRIAEDYIKLAAIEKGIAPASLEMPDPGGG
jgi:hypothetical protein